MSLSHPVLACRSRRWVASVALVSYLLAATISGMFHNHGGESCTEGACAQATATKKPSESRCSHSHGHSHAHHSHGGHSGHGHAAGTDQKSDQPTQHHSPLHHPDCAACQFLAQQSVTTPQVTLVVSAEFTSAVSETVESEVPTVVADAHPARGPPRAA